MTRWTSLALATALALICGCESVVSPGLVVAATQALKQRDYDLALRYIDFAIAFAPRAWNPRTVRAVVLLELGRPFDALDSARVAERLRPDHPTVRYALGESLYQTGAFQAAIGVLATYPRDEGGADDIGKRVDFLLAQAHDGIELAAPVEESLAVRSDRAVAGDGRCRITGRPSRAEQSTWTIEAVSFLPGCSYGQFVDMLEPYFRDVCNRIPQARCEFEWVVPRR